MNRHDLELQARDPIITEDQAYDFTKLQEEALRLQEQEQEREQELELAEAKMNGREIATRKLVHYVTLQCGVINKVDFVSRHFWSNKSKKYIFLLMKLSTKLRLNKVAQY